MIHFIGCTTIHGLISKWSGVLVFEPMGIVHVWDNFKFKDIFIFIFTSSTCFLTALNQPASQPVQLHSPTQAKPVLRRFSDSSAAVVVALRRLLKIDLKLLQIPIFFGVWASVATLPIQETLGEPGSEASITSFPPGSDRLLNNRAIPALFRRKFPLSTKQDFWVLRGPIISCLDFFFWLTDGQKNRLENDFCWWRLLKFPPPPASAAELINFLDVLRSITALRWNQSCSWHSGNQNDSGGRSKNVSGESKSESESKSNGCCSSSLARSSWSEVLFMGSK